MSERTERIGVRLYEWEHAAIESAAERSGVTPTVFVRQAALAAAGHSNAVEPQPVEA